MAIYTLEATIFRILEGINYRIERAQKASDYPGKRANLCDAWILSLYLFFTDEFQNFN